MSSNKLTKTIVNEELLFKIFEHLHVAIYIYDNEGRLLYINSAAARLDHLDRERDIGIKVEDIWCTTAFEPNDAPAIEALNTGKVSSHENLEWYRKDGTSVNAITSSYPIVSNNQVIGAFTLAENIESLKRHLIKQGAFKRKQSFRLRTEMLKNGTEYVFQDIVGNSDVMKNTIRLASRFAEKKSPVLIYGETGTGKEVFAQSIHNASDFAGGPFMAINCAAIPATLLESILFGTEKGTFTGAMDKEGLFEKAGNGSVFLDEINSMPLALQAKLLRAIQQKEIQRLGGHKTKKLNCRIISASNKEPRAAIDDMELREDLYYRLATGVIRIPPLRERSDDIIELVDFYIAKINEETESTIVGASGALLQLFKSYKWPGNIRELANVIPNAIIMTSESEIVLDVEHIPSFMYKIICEHFNDIDERTSKTNSDSFPPCDILSSMPLSGSLNEMVDAYEEMLLRSAMEAADGKIVKASKMLNITRQSLYVKLKKYGISKTDV